MRALMRLLVLALALGLVGCKKDEKPAKPAEPAAEEQEAAESPEPAPPSPEARPARPAEPAIKVLSVEEHAEEVAKQITEENYLDELAKLEDQIGRRVERSAVVPPVEPPSRDPATDRLARPAP